MKESGHRSCPLRGLLALEKASLKEAFEKMCFHVFSSLSHHRQIYAEMKNVEESEKGAARLGFLCDGCRDLFDSSDMEMGVFKIFKFWIDLNL